MLSDARHLPTYVKASEEGIPLCVGLNGTLIRTDSLVEGMISLVRQNALNIIQILVWLLRGRAFLKSQVASRASLSVHTLPADAPLLDWLKAQKATGRPLVLCTGANVHIAEQVAGHYGIFSHVLASSDQTNLYGQTKADRLVQQFGDQQFDYVGHDARDIPVWDHARRIILVRGNAKLKQRLSKQPNLEKRFDASPWSAAIWARALRLHQWAKNLLIFLPALGAHQLLEPVTLAAAIIAFLLFGVCASGTYVLNDLMDLETDRSHPSKYKRPFANGELAPANGLRVASLMIGSSLLLALLILGPLFFSIILLYLVTTVLYSSVFKRIAMVDVLTLAGLYTVRVLAGGAATGIVPSFWLLAFSMMMFMSLATAKRYAELSMMKTAGKRESAGRGYSVDDLPHIQACGIATGYLSVLVFALYIKSEPADMYSHPEIMWLLCPLMLYWISRIWIKTHRNQMHEDPVVFALKDKPSLATALLAGLLFMASI